MLVFYYYMPVVKFVRSAVLMCILLSLSCDIVYCDDIYQLMHHLQGMGENNCLIDRRHYISRKTLEEADRLYKVE